MKVTQWLDALHREIGNRPYIVRLDILDSSQSMLKARLYLSPDLFVQVYRNDRFDTTNLVLLYGGQRMYARDQVGGQWHRHKAAAPNIHDTSGEGQRSVELDEFLDEVEVILAEMGLP
jgi:hypothetical protein